MKYVPYTMIVLNLDNPDVVGTGLGTKFWKKEQGNTKQKII